MKTIKISREQIARIAYRDRESGKIEVLTKVFPEPIPKSLWNEYVMGYIVDKILITHKPSTMIGLKNLASGEFAYSFDGNKINVNLRKVSPATDLEENEVAELVAWFSNLIENEIHESFDTDSPEYNGDVYIPIKINYKHSEVVSGDGIHSERLVHYDVFAQATIDGLSFLFEAEYEC